MSREGAVERRDGKVLSRRDSTCRRRPIVTAGGVPREMIAGGVTALTGTLGNIQVSCHIMADVTQCWGLHVSPVTHTRTGNLET